MFLFPKWTALPVYWPEQTAEMTYIPPSLQLKSFSTLYSLLVTIYILVIIYIWLEKLDTTYGVP